LTLFALLFIFLAAAIGQTFGVMFGGGGFFVQPALLAAGVEAKQAIANDIASAALCSVAFLLTTKTHSAHIRAASMRFAPGLVIGAVIGSYAMTRMPESVVKWIILGVCTLGFLYIATHFRKKSQIHRDISFKHWKIALPVAGLVLGLYEGFIGAGGGILIIMTLSYIMRNDMKSIISMANWCSLFSLSAAGINYGIQGYLDWQLMAALVPGCLCAGFMGAKITDYVSEGNLRRVYIIVLSLLLSYLLIKNLMAI